MGVPEGQTIGSWTRIKLAARNSRWAQTVLLMIADAAVILSASALAFYLRFEGEVPAQYQQYAALTATAGLIAYVALLRANGLYHVVLRYVGIDVMTRLARAVVLGAGLLLLVDYAVSLVDGAHVVPFGVLAIQAVLVFLGTAVLRSVGRLWVVMSGHGAPGQHRALIVGAGDAGSLLLRDIENQPQLGYLVVGFLDDAPRKQNLMVRGKRILGAIEDLPAVADRERIEEVLVAIPSMTGARRREVLELCTQARVRTRMISGIAADAVTAGLTDLRQVAIEDLLGRDPVHVDVDAISATLTDKVVAVTGAAGSIGSELCRQIMLMRPRRLHLLEIDETRLYEVYLELRESDRDVPQMHICDVRGEDKVATILAGAGVDVVFHAAAYKHVPLMELAPDEAVKMNVGGTRAVLRACATAGVGHFVLISTDKAVNPSSVMGATKALAERLTFCAAQRGLKATAVRFGNVLGSRGSVVPLFEQQLRSGGPVLVTHPEITRYFMTIPEAARLVLQAQAISDGGELFVLEMGEPVRIVDLARKMIALSGSSAEIEFQGLRPGEKMHEVLVHDDHELVATGAEKVLRLNALPLGSRDFTARVEDLIDFARAGRCAEVLDLMAALLPDFDPSAAKVTCNASDPGALGMDADMETLF
jgi:FlaA1/EpsC-like NDP-sugar epimerase